MISGVFQLPSDARALPAPGDVELRFNGAQVSGVPALPEPARVEPGVSARNVENEENVEPQAVEMYRGDGSTSNSVSVRQP